MGTRTTIALVGTAVLGLTACSGGVELDQAETAEVLLSSEEFPLDGFTRGEVEESAPDNADPTSAPSEDSLAALLQDQDVPEVCLEALEATDLSNDDFTAQSSVLFSQGDASTPLPTTVNVVVATVEGESPLEPLSSVNEECDEITLDEAEGSMVMSFEDLDSLDGTKLSVAMGELTVDMIMGGTMEDQMIVAGFSTGLSEDQLVSVIDAQVEKLSDVQD
ncbi:MAG: hypothetical protein WBA72_14500 [Ornithinimicrobium sp.]